MSRKKRWLLGLAASLVAVVAAATLVTVLIVRSPWFHDQVRQRIVREIEDATGGRVEIASFAFHWHELRAEVRGLTVHGLEPAGAPPLFRSESVTVGIHIVSVLRKKVDLTLLAVHSPEVNVTVGPDGRTNVPAPRIARRSTKKPVEQFLDLAIQQLRISRGKFRYRDSIMPLDVSGEQVQAVLAYELAGPAYSGNLEARNLRVAEPLAVPVVFDTAFSLRFERDRATLSGVRIRSGSSSFVANARVESFEKPQVEGKFEGSVAVADVAPVFRLPIHRSGSAQVSGTLAYRGRDAWSIDGEVTAAGLGLDRSGVALRGIGAKSPFHLGPQQLELPNLRADLLGGEFQGRLSVARWDTFDLDGTVSGFALQRLKETDTGNRPLVNRFAFSGTVSGPVKTQGSFRDWRRLRIGADLAIERGEAGVPLDGRVAFEYDYGKNHLSFQDSHVELPQTRAHFRGSLETGIEVGLFSRDLQDVLPALALVSEQPPSALPVQLAQGNASFQGVVKGSLDNPTISGRLDASSVLFQDRHIRQLTVNLEASPSQLRVSRLALEQTNLRLDGFVTIGLDRWRIAESGELNGQVSLRQGRIEQMLAENRVELPLQGTVSGFVDLRGTIGTPRGSGSFTMTSLVVEGETLDRVDGEIRLSNRLIEVPNLRARRGNATLEASGAFERSADEWATGTLRFEASTKDLRLEPWKAVDLLRPDLDGGVAGKVSGIVRITNGHPELTSLDGDLRIDNLTVSGRSLGDAVVSSRTSGRLMTVLLSAGFGDSKFNGKAEWSLTANSFGLGQLQVTNLTFATLQNLGLFGDPYRALPFRGSLDGEIGFSGPVLRPENWTGAAKITSLELVPDFRRPMSPADLKRFTIRNRETMIAYMDTRGLHIQQARMVAEGTDLEASGTVGFRGRAAWNLQLKGTVDLPVLGAFEPDLLADGRSTVDAVIRGNLSQPQITGRMDLADASFYVRDVPNGLDKTTGTIRFDRTRATIEKLTAQTGGGDLTLSGFVGFGGEELVYRLQATAQRVRVRYPEAVSTTFNSTLSLTGTSSRRLLSGTVTVTRMGITPRTDIGSLLAETGRSVAPVSTPNPFLRGMQLDVHVETAPDAEFQTSLTRDIQPEADLRLRGTATRPVVLGRVSVNQGEIQFFGTQYTITRGDISFFNPVKIEPVLSLDLETRVRGITVTINFTGPIDKLNMNYRSDPPLQSTEIIALLTVGRAPTTGPSATSSTNPSQGFLTAGSNSLLGQAVAAPLSGRLQRLLGVSRLKIDPELTGVTNTPQARVTFEQQLSREITLTYTTNLNRTQQQIVRLQWDFSKDFSLLAVRDENGIFGVDFLYRRRFK